MVEKLRWAPETVRRVLLVPERRGGAKSAEEMARRLDVPLRYVTRAELDHLAGDTKHQGIAAYVCPYRYSRFEEVLAARAPRVLFLDGVNDPRNFGAILRSAEAFGAGAVVVPSRRAAPLSPTVVRTAAGALEYIKVCQVVNLSRALDQAKHEGYWLIGLDPGGDRLLTEIEPAAQVGLVVGGESRGLREGVKKRCDFLARILMEGRVGSLNAGVAAAVGLFWLMSGIWRPTEG